MAISLFSFAKPLVLASSSSIRKDLLRRIAPDFDVVSPAIDESLQAGESTAGSAQRLALEKAQKVAEHKPNHYIIGSDQMAICGSDVISKPITKAKAIEQLTLQSGRCTQFYTGICVLNSATQAYQVDAIYTAVKFRQLSKQEIEDYVAVDQPMFCAGSFKAEANGIALFESVESSDPTALLGLPLIRLAEFLRGLA